MPPPSRHNSLKFRPHSQSIYPTTVFECAVTHQSRERLLADAEEKHFHVNTSIMVWIGLKVKLNATQNGGGFWLGWGRRRVIGCGLRLEEQTEDLNGDTTFLPIQSQNPLPGGLTIPSTAIFGPLQPPATSPPNLWLAFEDVRLAISDGLEYM
jgi:hypothetical protein